MYACAARINSDDAMLGGHRQAVGDLFRALVSSAFVGCRSVSQHTTNDDRQWERE